MALAVDPTLDRVPDSARLLRSLAGLSIVGLSIAMSLRFAAMPKLHRFIASNTLASKDRTELLVTAALGAFLPALLAGGVLILARKRGSDLIETGARLLAPLALCALLPLLFCAPAWRGRPLPFLALLSLVGVLTIITTTIALQTPQLAAGRPLRRLFAPFAWPARALERRTIALAVVCIAGAASLAFAPRSETLLVIQTTAVGMAALPLFLFAETQLTRPAAVLLALGYLLFAPVQRAMLDDFHWITWIPFVVFWLCYAIAKRNPWLIAVAVASVATGSWWLVSTPKLFAAPGDASAFGSHIRALAINPAYAVTTLLTEAKLIYCLHLLAPLAFLPLRRPALALLALPGVLFTLLAPENATPSALTDRSAALWIPYLFGSSVLVLRVIGQDSGRAHARAALAALALGVIAHSYAFGGLGSATKPQSRRSNGPPADSTYAASARTAGSSSAGEIGIRRSPAGLRSIRDQLPLRGSYSTLTSPATAALSACSSRPARSKRQVSASNTRAAGARAASSEPSARPSSSTGHGVALSSQNVGIRSTRLTGNPVRPRGQPGTRASSGIRSTSSCRLQP